MQKNNVPRPSSDPNCGKVNLASMEDLGITDGNAYARAMKDLGLSINTLDDGEEYYTDMKAKCKKESKNKRKQLKKTIVPTKPVVKKTEEPTLYATVSPNHYMAHSPVLSTDRGHTEKPFDTTKAIEDGFKEAAVDGIILALKNIPEDKRVEGLNKFFDQLKSKNPLLAKKTAIDLVKLLGKNVKEFKNLMRQQFVDLEKGTKKTNEKTLWKSEGILFDYYNGNFDGLSMGSQMAKMRESYKGLTSVDKTKIESKLNPVLDQSKKNLEQNIRQATALDLLETGFSTLNETFTDRKGLAEFMSKSKSEQSESLEGGFFSIDRDEEVYFSSKEIYEALIKLVSDQYAKDLISGAKKPDGSQFSTKEQADLGKNPLKYYFEHLADYQSQFRFVNLKEETRLFNAYNRGEEQMGEGGMYNLWQGGERGMFFDKIGSNGDKAFMENHATRNGLVAQSEYIFNSPLLEDTASNANGLGVVEKARLLEMQNLKRLKKYGELRQLVMELATNRNFKRPTESDIKAEAKRFKETAEGQRMKANVELQVESNLQMLIDDNSNNITNETEALAATAKVLGRTGKFDKYVYKSLMISDTFTGKARQDLFFKQNVDMDQSSLSEFDKQLSNMIEDLNDNLYMEISEESLDTGISHAKTVGEIVAAAAITSATGGAATAVFGGMARTSEVAAGRALSMSRKANALRFIGRGVAGGSKLALKSGTFLEAENLLHNGKEWAYNELVIGEHRDKAMIELAMVMASLKFMGGVSKYMNGGSKIPMSARMGSINNKLVKGGVNLGINTTAFTGFGLAEQKYIMPKLLDTTDGSALYRSRKRDVYEMGVESAIMAFGLQFGGLGRSKMGKPKEDLLRLEYQPKGPRNSESIPPKPKTGLPKAEIHKRNARIERLKEIINNVNTKKGRLIDEKNKLDEIRDKKRIEKIDIEIRKADEIIAKRKESITKLQTEIKNGTKPTTETKSTTEKPETENKSPKSKKAKETIKSVWRKSKEAVNNMKLGPKSKDIARRLAVLKKLSLLVTKYKLGVTKNGLDSIKKDRAISSANGAYEKVLKQLKNEQQKYRINSKKEGAIDSNSPANENIKRIKELKRELQKKQSELNKVLDKSIDGDKNILQKEVDRLTERIEKRRGGSRRFLNRRRRAIKTKIKEIENMEMPPKADVEG